MSLPIGARLGVYEIIGTLGAGGMGEVYRARDTRLGRDIAIKVLPESFAHDPERLARFEREARTLAALNHPHIAQIHGLEESSGAIALVMELVDGDELTDRIRHGALPLHEALAIARQLAEALEAAHDAGIVHRDLKPANIKVRSDGSAKVLDFGLAKALNTAAGIGDAAIGPADSPTLTSPAMTRAGVILGTAAYMAPEQAKGRAVDKRSDIWAFGCVLYEMLTGRRAFAGEDVTDTLTSIMRDPPDWRRLPSGTPANVRHILRRCLEKNAVRRLRDIGEARVLLQDRADELELTDSTSQWQWKAVGSVALGAVVVGAIAGIAVVAWRQPARPVPKPVVRFTLPVLPTAPVFRSAGGGLIFSRDGQKLVYVVRPEGQSRAELRIRRLDSDHDEPMPGTEGGFAPFFSPDGQAIGFFADQKLKKIAIVGGPPTTICDQGRFSRAVWTDDHTILLGTSQASRMGSLARVSDGGGVPVDFTTLVRDRDWAHQSPQTLPDRRHFLFTVVGTAGSEIALGDLLTGEHRILFDGSFATWLPPDRILFAKAAELFAVPFDLGTLTVSGTQERVLEDATTMQFGGTVSIPLLAIDDDGSIAYAGVQRGGVGSIVRIDTRGRLTALPSAPASYSSPRISSDGSRIAVSIAGDDRRSDIWIIDSVRGTRIRLTSQGGTSPAWSADGREIIFTTSGFSNETYGALARMPSDGSGAPKLVVETPGASSQQLRAIGSWGGTTMVFARLAGVRGRLHSDLFHVVEGKDPVAILATPADERTPGVSPDGKWCAYVSNASGRDEIYLKNLSAAAAMIPVSAAGGVQPVGRATDGRCIFAERIVSCVPHSMARPAVWGTRRIRQQH
jgi:hypothetical protein